MASRLTAEAFSSALEAKWPRMLDREEVTRRALDLYAWFCDYGLKDAKFDSEFSGPSDYKMRQHLSEMLVAKKMHDAGYSLSRSPRKGGPDFLAERGSQRLQLEIVTPEPTEEVKQYLNRNGNGVFHVPHNGFFECWTKGIAAKCTQALGPSGQAEKGWVSKGLLDESVPFVIVVNGALFRGDWADHSFSQFGYPMAVRALYAMSEHTLFLSVNGDEEERAGYLHREKLERTRGQPIPLNTFLEDRYAPVSAVWALAIDEYDLRFDDPVLEEVPDDQSTVVHNPHATRPIDPGVLPAGDEFICLLERSGYQIQRVPGKLLERAF